MLNALKKNIEIHRLIDKSDRLLIALSGGADSVALLALLVSLKQEYNLTLSAMHVHHGIRGDEADKDADFAKKLAESFSIECYIKHVDVPAYAKECGLSIEEAARLLRYKVLEERAELINAKIVTAHHKDDKAETFIINLLRGSSLKGLGSIRELRANIIRPLLDASKEDILKFIELEGLEFIDDSSNSEDIYTRNYIRRHIMPRLKSVNQEAIEHISKASDDIYRAYEYIYDNAVKAAGDCLVLRKDDKVYDIKGFACSKELGTGKPKEGTDREGMISIDGGSVSSYELGISLKNFDKEAAIIRGYIIQYALKLYIGRLKDISAVHIEDIKALKEKNVGAQIHLPYNLLAYRDYEHIWIVLKTIYKKAIKQVDSRHYDIDNLCSMKILAYEKGMELKDLKYVKYFDADKFDTGLVLRTRQSGDYIAIKSGKKSIKAFMTDEKIEARKRDGIPLLACGSHIVWIVGYRISEHYKIEAETKNVLQIEYLKGEEEKYE